MTDPTEYRDRTARTRGSIILALVTLALPALLLLTMTLFAPRLRVDFAEFDVPLSAVTQIALGSALPLTLGALLLFTFLKEFVGWSRRLVDTWNIVALLLVLVMGAVYVVGVVVPSLSLMRTLR